MPEANKAEEVLDIFQKVIPRLSDRGLERLLSYGEGMLVILQERDKDKTAEPAS